MFILKINIPNFKKGETILRFKHKKMENKKREY